MAETVTFRTARLETGKLIIDIPYDQNMLEAKTTASEILVKTGINPDTRVRDLTDDEVGKLRDIIDKEYVVEGDVRREVSLNIKRLMEIGCYRGRRHKMGLPVRGQRTKTNARTRKGPARPIAGKKK